MDAGRLGRFTRPPHGAFALCSADFLRRLCSAKRPRQRAVQRSDLRAKDKSGINFSHICPQCGQSLCGPKEAPGKGSAETLRWGECPPIWVGQASRPAIRRPHSPGRCPVPPAPKGEKKCNSERRTTSKICAAVNKKEPVRPKPFSSKSAIIRNCRLHQCYQREGVSAQTKNMCLK